MKEMIGDYDPKVKALIDEISSGKRIDFALLNHINPVEDHLEYYLCYAVDWFMIRHNLTRKKATNVLILNLRYCVGYYDADTMKIWRESISKLMKERH